MWKDSKHKRKGGGKGESWGNKPMIFQDVPWCPPMWKKVVKHCSEGRLFLCCGGGGCLGWGFVCREGVVGYVFLWWLVVGLLMWCLVLGVGRTPSLAHDSPRRPCPYSRKDTPNEKKGECRTGRL